MSRAVFFDRDGTLIQDVHYLKDPKDIILIDGVSDSLKRIKALPKDTEIYCGHEYTLQNSKFCTTYDPSNLQLKTKIAKIKKKLDI